MSDTREFQSVVHAAEQAAAAGDYKSAEELLHTAALLQEASLGPLHPDLASTLNNLGVVCEITGNVADAERYFRRAWEIAHATLEPDNPFVATSRKNLEDFCNTRGIPVDLPSAAPVPPAPVASQAPTAAPARPAPVGPPPAIVGDNLAPPTSRVDRPIERQTREDSRPLAAEPSSRRIPVAALFAGALIVAILAVVVWRNMSAPADVPREAAAPNHAPVAVAPPAVQAPEATPASPPIVKPTPPPPPAAAPTSRARTAVPAAPPVVVTARLCKELSTGSDWHCAPADSPIESGAVYFFSRVKSPTDTTIRHRWYHGGRVLRTAELRIGANATDGYRTFSRTTVNGRGSADWKVELISEDGVVLHEERFVVR